MKNRLDFILEFIDTEPNSEIEVKGRDLLAKLNDYNQKKNSLSSIMTGNKPTEWEKKAALVIKGNELLASHWRLLKLTNDIKQAEAEIQAGDKQGEDLKALNDRLNLAKKELVVVKNDIKKKLADAKASSKL